MKYTYEDDISFVYDLEIIRQSVLPQLKEINHAYPELFVVEDESINTFISKIRSKSESEVECKKQEKNKKERRKSTI